VIIFRIKDDSRRGGGNYKDIASTTATARSVRGLYTDLNRHVTGSIP